MRRLIQEIHNGKNLKSNLKKYKEMAVPVYAEYTALELTFSAYTMVQVIVEEKTEIAEKENRILEKIFGALGTLGSGAGEAELIDQMRRLRQEITDKMDLFTSYTDRLLVYEYALNRMEYRYLPEKELSQKLARMDEAAFMQRLSAYLFSEKDQSVIHERIRQVIGQVPVHMTRNKFFQQIREAMTLYQDADRVTLENFIYMVRTASLVYEPKKYVGEYPAFEVVLRQLETADYADMDPDAYETLAGLLEEGARQILEVTDFYYNLQKVVNGIYAMCLIRPYEENESRLVRACRSIWVCLARKEYQDEMLSPLEGRIEELLERSSHLETVLFEIKSSYQDELESLGLVSFYADFARVANLLSDSLFIDLDRAADEEKADPAYVQKRTEELVTELSGKLDEMPRPVRRAVMGQVIEKLPMMFENTEQIQQYIQVNLMGCQDKAEKYASMLLLRDLMSDEC